jgi:hypothetical protein
MSRSAVLASILLALAPTFATADVPVIQNTSLVRVRADNRFGVAKQHDLMPFVGMDTSDAISDTEASTAASSSCSATYQMTLSGTTLTIAIQALQAASASAHGNLAEGFIHFTLSEPYEYIVSGGLNGSGADPGDGYQQRTFLRLFQSPFTTVFLEDETGFGSAVSLAVNQANNAGSGGIYNQSGPRVGILAPGTYEFNYELEGRDNDLDGAAAHTVSGEVTLVLRRPGTGLPAPTSLAGVVNGLNVLLSWIGALGATSYQLEAGSGPGLSDVFVGNVGNVTALPASGPPGTYYVRVRAVSGGMSGPPSNEIVMTLGAVAPCAPPAAPSGLAFTKNGPLLTVTWIGAAGAAVYRLHAGTGSGLNNAYDSDVGAGTTVQFNVSGVPAGTYFVRVSARNACGTSGPSNEVAIPIP